MTKIEIIWLDGVAWKKCISCLQVLVMDEQNFYKAKRNKTGFAGQCKPCRNMVIRVWQLDNPDKTLTYSQNDCVKNRERRLISSRKSREADPERHRQRCRDWRSRNLDYARELCRIWVRENPEKYKESLQKHDMTHPEERAETYKRHRLKKKYNLTLEQYEDACQAQNNKCYICDQESKKPLCVDHNHDTGELRGLLCNVCNLMLGYSKDKIEILLRAIDYLSNPPGVGVGIDELEEVAA